MDPYGHLAPWLYKDIMDKEDIEIRPTIAITRAHMKLPEMEESVKKGRLVPDGKICINETGEVAVTKVAVEPVWYLPGVAERFGIGTFYGSRTCFRRTNIWFQMRGLSGEHCLRKRVAHTLSLLRATTLSYFSHPLAVSPCTFLVTQPRCQTLTLAWRFVSMTNAMAVTSLDLISARADRISLLE